MAKVVLGTLTFYGLLVASALSTKVDHMLLWVVLGIVALAVLSGIVYWVVGEISVWWECVRPNPPVPEQKPVYWHERQPVNREGVERGHHYDS